MIPRFIEFRCGASLRFAGLALLCLGSLQAGASEAAVTIVDRGLPVLVRNVGELRAAVRTAGPGTRLAIAPGDYPGGLTFEGLRGEPGNPVVIAAADPTRPPRFTGGANGMHLVNPFFVELHDLHFSGATGNGLNIDDGGRTDAAARGIVLRRLQVRDVGPRGNCDGIKLSGLTGFLIEECTVENWGAEGGSGIDMVGCHDGTVARSVFRHSADQQSTGAHGVQAKGGSRNIIIRSNRFEHAGTRAINLGGSTGRAFFRPALDAWPAGVPLAEAAELTVEENFFLGSAAPLAFVGVDGATVRRNTIMYPGRWVIRILQENRTTGFVASRRVRFTDNTVVFRSTTWSEGGVNIGSGTLPGEFEFARNIWYCEDRPELSRPGLPTSEQGGTYGIRPAIPVAPATSGSR